MPIESSPATSTSTDGSGRRPVISKWVFREPTDDLRIYPIPQHVREDWTPSLAASQVRCYLFNALERSRNFHAPPFSAGLFVDERMEAYLNAVITNPVHAGSDVVLERTLLSLGILTYDDSTDEQRHWSLLENARPKHPTISWIEITNRCQMTCSFCDRSELSRKIGDMSKETLARGLEECGASGQKVVQLYGLGEPLLHPELPEFVRMASQAGLMPAFSCVPVDLPPELSERLIRSGLRSIIFSIDSLDPEVFRQIRGKKADLEKCLQNIASFVQINESLGKPVQTTVRMISLNANEPERDTWIDYWRSRRIDVVYIRPFGIHEHHLEDRRRSYQEFRGAWTSMKLCTWPWHGAVATVDGDLHACCLRSSGPMKMGSWLRGSSEQVWNGPTYQSLRTALIRGEFDRDHPCSTCTHSFHNIKKRIETMRRELRTIDDLPAVGWEF